MGEFKFTNNQLEQVDLGITATTVADPNRVVVTDTNGYMTTSDITVQQLEDTVTGALTYDNGITKNLSSVQLGGALVHNTSITSTGFTLDYTTSGFGNNILFFLDKNASIPFLVNVTGGGANIFLGVGTFGVRMLYDGGTSSFSMENVFIPAGIDYPAHSSLFTVQDTLYSRGVEYLGNYEANFVARSLVTKRYVDALVAPVTASNGLTKTGNDIALGGLVTISTSLVIDINKVFDISTSPSSNFASTIFLDGSNGSIGISAYNVITNKTSSVGVYTDNTFINTSSELGTIKEIRLSQTTNGISVLDSINSIGFRYVGDYSTNNTNASYNAGWIPDLGYVRKLTGVGSVSLSGTVLTFDSGMLYKTVSTNTTFTVSPLNPFYEGRSVTVEITNSSVSEVTITMPAGTKIAGFPVNTFTVDPSSTNVFTMIYLNSKLYVSPIQF